MKFKNRLQADPCVIRVEDYKDEAEGEMVESTDEGERFTSAVLHPVVTISGGDPNVARELHDVAHRMCFITNSVNFPVRHQATITTLTQSIKDSDIAK